MKRILLYSAVNSPISESGMVICDQVCSVAEFLQKPVFITQQDAQAYNMIVIDGEIFRDEPGLIDLVAFTLRYKPKIPVVVMVSPGSSMTLINILRKYARYPNLFISQSGNVENLVKAGPVLSNSPDILYKGHPSLNTENLTQ